jgi:type II secretory pathway pseudopilin PulG
MTIASVRPIVADSTEAGFSILELLVASTLLLIVSSIVSTGLLQMTNAQRTIWNRTEMHSGVRSATELLQQEVGQAGRVSLPATLTLNGGVASGATTMTLTPTVSGIFVNELLVLDTGANAETVKVSAVNAVTKAVTISQSVNYNGVQIQPSFRFPHPPGAAVNVGGGFTTGVIPPAAAPVNFVNGSTANVLKLYGDINGDGNMVYVEYTCDTAAGNLYRNSMPFTNAAKPPLTADQVLLSGIAANPLGVACFQYQMDAANQYVLDVAITLTVNTQQIDPITRQLQQETKALLNVSPRNVVNAWELVGHQYGSRVQPTPPTVTTLIGL